MCVLLYNGEISSTSMTTTSSQGTVTVSTGQELYDTIMRSIDPELTSDQVGLLPEKYKNESEEQKKQRAARYTKAFVEYDKQANFFFAGLQAQVSSLKKKAFASAEEKNRSDEDKQLEQLTSQISA